MMILKVQTKLSIMENWIIEVMVEGERDARRLQSYKDRSHGFYTKHFSNVGW